MTNNDKLVIINRWGFLVQLNVTSYGITYINMHRAVPEAIPRFQKVFETRDDAIEYAYGKVNMLIWESVGFWTRRGFIGPKK